MTGDYIPIQNIPRKRGQKIIQPPQKKKSGSDFFDNALDKIFKLSPQQWMLIGAGILLLVIWALGSLYTVVFALILSTISFFLGSSWQKGRNKFR